MKPRVLYFANSDQLHPSITGSAIRYSYIITAWEKHFGLKVTVLDNRLIKNRQFYKYLKERKCHVEIVTFPYFSFLPYKLRILFHIIFSSLKSILLSYRIDLLYCHFVPALFLPAVITKIITRKKLIVTVQLLTPRTNAFTENLMYALLQFADKVLVENKAYFKRVNHKHTYETFHAISPVFYPSTYRSTLKYDLCFTGSVDDNRKGIREFIDTAVKLKKSGVVKSALVITQSQNLEFLNSSLGQNNFIQVKRNLSQIEVKNCLEKSRLFLFPTQAESYGLVIGEALRLGVPVVTTRIPELDIWQDLAILTNDYYSACKRVLTNYKKFTSKLKTKVKSSKLLNLTWTDVALVEANYIKNTLYEQS